MDALGCKWASDWAQKSPEQRMPRQALWGFSGVRVVAEDSFVAGEHSKRIMQNSVSCCSNS